MKVTKTEIRFKTGFQQPKTGFPKKPVLTSLVRYIMLHNVALKHVVTECKMMWGRGGSLVGSTPFIRRVTSTNPALVTM